MVSVETFVASESGTPLPHEIANELSDLIGSGVEREAARFEDVNMACPYAAAIDRRLRWLALQSPSASMIACAKSFGASCGTL